MKKVILSLTLLGVAVFAQEKGTFTDKRDGKEYKTIEMGNQVWMAENLNFETKTSRCYDNNPKNCEKYGRLYDWETAKDVCPYGWHLPFDIEWDNLYRFSDGSGGKSSLYISETAGKHLKAKSGWNDHQGKSGNGSDTYGFAALPGGMGTADGRASSGIGSIGTWWSASQHEQRTITAHVYIRGMSNQEEYARVTRFESRNPMVISVRCVKD
jgi:uncharacterized protein (TIGR02145 family)